MAIDVVNIRAAITCKDTGLDIVTPYIQNFNVNKARGVASSFSASVKVQAQDLDKVSGEIKIYAGTTNDMPLIFTGYIKKVVPSPVWDDPGYLMLNITGTDVLHRLNNKRFTRRQEVSDSSWAVITGVRDGLKSSRLKYAANEPMLVPTKQGLVEDARKETLTTTENSSSSQPQGDTVPINMTASIGYMDDQVNIGE